MEGKYICDYMHQEEYRQALNQLTRKTFSFDFENWYKNGYYENLYIPHSIINDGELIANVSVNLMEFTLQGERKHYIQLGTVMTDEKFRNRGYGKMLLEKVLDKYRSKADGIYLFGNDSAVDYYPRFGFQKGIQYGYRASLKNGGKGGFEKVNRTDSKERARFQSYMKNAARNEELSMENFNYGLLGFYMDDMENIYYSRKLDTYISADQEGDTLFLHAVLAKQKVSVHSVADEFNPDIKKMVLGFTPIEKAGFIAEERKVDDCTFFYIGDDLKCIMDQKLMFPEFSHA